jgi:RHS repeat-associated protein
VTDNSGNILEQYEYNAQGQFQITNASGQVQTGTQISNDLLYTGRNYDDETGNYFYRARYYNPQLGRFISRDPLSGAEFSQGTNLYCYVQNNYLNLLDPMGTSFWGGVTNVGFAAAEFTAGLALLSTAETGVGLGAAILVMSDAIVNGANGINQIKNANDGTSNPDLPSFSDTAGPGALAQMGAQAAGATPAQQEEAMADTDMVVDALTLQEGKTAYDAASGLKSVYDDYQRMQDDAKKDQSDTKKACGG